MTIDVPKDCLAFFCSNACPGDIILKAQDWASERSPQSAPVIGGFHTPVEKEVLRLLMRNSAPVVYVLARSMEGWRKPRDIAKAMGQGSLVVISPFDTKKNRTTAKTAAIRNDLIVSIVDEVLIAHASNSGKTEALARSVIDQGKKLLTFASPSNASLVELGAINV
jgi:predicted Rossmann fold nucleotide-binding protein DprA/Smf involved in DNA uptake